MIHIIGGGIAGYTTAIGLHNAGQQVTIWEKDAEPFLFASSKNSAMARSYDADPYLSYYTKKSFLTAFSLQEKLKTQFIDTVGLFICPTEFDYYDQSNDAHAEKELEGLLSTHHTYKLPNGSLIEGQFIVKNGFLNLENINNYLKNQIQSLNINVNFIQEAHTFTVKSKRIISFVVQDNKGVTNTIVLNNTDIVVNAAGSWAMKIMQDSKIETPKLLPHKRHLYLLEDERNLFANAPVIWNERDNYYLRKYENGVLVSHCDETPAVDVGNYDVDESELSIFKFMLEECLPFLVDAKILKTWACLRTFSLDNRPIIGFDPKLENLFWCAGLGGRGMSLVFEISNIVHSIFKLGFNKKETETDNPFTAFRF